MLKEALVFLLFFAASLNAAIIKRGPYVEDFTQKSAVISFRTFPATFTWLTYGAYPDCERFATFSGFDTDHKIRLNGLLEDTTHCYRIYLPVDLSTYSYKAFEGYFRTFREEKNEILSFLVLGTSNDDGEDQKKLADSMLKIEDSEFAVHTGNVVKSGLDKDANEEYFLLYKDLIKRIPVYISLGDLDFGPNFNNKDGAGFLKENFIPYRSWPRNGMGPHYYFFDQAHARFIVLDSNAFAGGLYSPELKKDSKQYIWLENVLKNDTHKWKFVVIHHPIYSSSFPTIAEEKEVLTPMFETYGVDMVFQYGGGGYERFKPIREDEEDESGVTYVSLGWGQEDKKEDNPLTDIFLAGNYFAHIKIEGLKLEMKIYDSSGTVKDVFVLEKK
ncbi:MAG: metallophosphoesterase [Elusimicrobiota bacterium]